MSTEMKISTADENMIVLLCNFQEVTHVLKDGVQRLACGLEVIIKDGIPYVWTVTVTDGNNVWQTLHGNHKSASDSAKKYLNRMSTFELKHQGVMVGLSHVFIIDKFDTLDVDLPSQVITVVWEGDDA